MKASKVIVFMLLGITSFSCRKDLCQEEAPVLEFDGFEYIQTGFSDSLIIRTTFTDCDGDIGVKEGEEGVSMFTYQYELINGVWQRFIPINPSDTTLYFVEIPYSDEIKEGRPLEGTIEQRLGNARQNSDTVRFETQLIDRAGNKSARITTDVFVFPN